MDLPNRQSFRLKLNFHFVGVGGIGMCGLAELLKNMGAQVSGSDLGENAQTEHLKNMGVIIYKGHTQENLRDETDVVVYSSAVPFDNPELKRARKLKIPLIPRAEALAEIMRLKRGIAVGGTHGKTTTTSMIASIFLYARTNPTIVVGGRLDAINSTALLGDGEWLIAEADESDGSFQRLSPEIGVITNIDSDHLDYYKSFDQLKSAFLQFAEQIPFYGCLIGWGEDPHIKSILSQYHKPIWFYGWEPENDYWLTGERQKYQIRRGLGQGYSHNHGSGAESSVVGEGEEILGEFEVQLPGRHNALNALAAILVGYRSGLPLDVCCRGIGSFRGVDRRFHLKGELKNEILVYDDYGHHPTEIRATLESFREKFPQRRLVIFFQPHRYTRTQICWQEFLTCFKNCDLLLMTDIYAASEKPLPGITTEHLVKDMNSNMRGQNPVVKYYGRNDPLLLDKIKTEIRPGDIFLTLGAGDGWKLGEALVKSNIP